MRGIKMENFELGKQMGAVICQNCGNVALTDEQYDYEMSRPDSLWICPICNSTAIWDDDNYDLYCELNYPEELN
jgi:hypothetical protein